MNAKHKQSFIFYILPPIIIILAIGIAIILIKTKERPKQKPPSERAAIIQTMPLSRTSTQVLVATSGTVIPARQISLQARVSGELIKTSPDFEPGGQFSAGEAIAWIDPTDYEVALTARQADLSQAQLNYKNELGMQEIARHEWDLIDDHENASELEQELVLRKPYLISAKASLKSAEAAVQKARLDLERTTLKAPFNAVILSKHVDLGAQINVQTPVATIVDKDEYWVNITLPIDKLQWINSPNDNGRNGSKATIVNSIGQTWSGHVIRIAPALEAQGRLAQLIVSIPDPFASDHHVPLLLNSYVTVYIEGQTVSNAFILSRSQIRDNNTVWLCSSDNRLHIQPVTITWKDRDIAVITDGLDEGDELIVTDIPAPAEGLLLQMINSTPSSEGDTE